MPRKLIISSANLPYHINARCINREWFNLPMPVLWEIMEDYLFFIHFAYQIKIFSFVLMQNHFHLIASSPKNNLGLAMNYFMRETSLRINERTGRINQTYGNRFHRSLITAPHHFHHVYKYVYRNPVKAGLSLNVEDYPFSTLSGLIGKTRLVVPLEEDNLLFSDCEQKLKWLNTPPTQENLETMKKALRRRVFELPKNKNTKAPSLLETEDF